jgi:perosamine synthetase
MEQIDRFIEIKCEMARQYTEGLSGLPGLKLPVEKPEVKNVYWMYAIELAEESGFNAEQLAAALAGKGIATRPFFLGLHEQPVFHNMGLFVGEQFPVAERIARRGLYLPSGLTITGKDIDSICKKVKEIICPNII